MKKGDWINTPRFLKVKIEEVYETENDALKSGFCEPTHYKSSEYKILGKNIGNQCMIFAAAKKR